MKQLVKTADVPNSNLPMHRLNLDLVTFLHHCVEPAEFGQQNTIGDVEMGAGLEHAAGECAGPISGIGGTDGMLYICGILDEGLICAEPIENH